MTELPDPDRRIQEVPSLSRPLEVDEDYSRAPGSDLPNCDLMVSVVGTLLNLLVVFGLGIALASAGVGLGLFLLVFQIVLYGWLLFAYLSYRQGRQDELLLVLTTAIESGAPLPAALRAYVADRPHGGFREFLVAAALCLLLPGYYWLWYRWYNYDRLVERLAQLLEQGVVLDKGLREVRGLVPREIILAAVVGQNTGQLALCLRYASRRTLTDVWAEVLPRLLYPLGLFIYVTLVVSFWSIYLLPKFQRIIAETGKSYPDVELPPETTWFIQFWPVVNLIFWLLLVLGLFLFVVQLSMSTVRWYFPVVGWFYRKHVQSRFLQMFGVLLNVGKPIPESLRLLADAGYFQGIALARLEMAGRDVSGGEALAPSLVRAGLLPEPMAALVQAAERMRNLPSTLTELGEHLRSRLARWLRWFSLVFSPLSVLAVGWLVYLVARCIFSPLIKLMEVLS